MPTEKTNNHRNSFEKWLDQYNHIMELVRTLTAILVLLLQIIILLKLFGIF